VSDETGSHAAGAHGSGSGGHDHPHLPPPSLIPINVAIALAVTFVGFLGDIRNVLGPTMWLIGLLWLVVSLLAWVRAARREHLELPEDASSH
jgi:hypothetical protein